MEYLKDFLILLIGIFVGAILHVIRQQLQKKEESKLEEIKQLQQIECEDCDIEYFVKKWQTTIESQMHFNDLIIRFRSIVLSVFIASLGFIYGVSEKLSFTDDTKIKWFFLVIIFWICCFLLDYFYYHQLLLGSIEHSCKFDNNKRFREKGLFGLTKTISIYVNATSSKILIWTFYLLPLIGLLTFIYFKYFNKTIINS
ncbi:MAG: hypothetical protein KIS94_09900 [Chitinophagales bacterium]|nr:hypothetical protein [Chitinophagales bacterium]